MVSGILESELFSIRACWAYAFSTLTLLVERQEGHPAVVVVVVSAGHKGALTGVFSAPSSKVLDF